VSTDPKRPARDTYEAMVWSRLHAAACWLVAHGDVVDRSDARDVLEIIERNKKRHP